MSSLTDIRQFDLKHLPSDFYQNPYPYYTALQMQAPFHQMPDGSYLLTRYADVEAVYKDPVAFSSDKRVEFKPKFGDSPLFEHHTTSLVFNAPQLHSRVRKIITGALTPAAIANMQGGLNGLVQHLLTDLPNHVQPDDSVDLVEHFASAIPVDVVSQLLGVPPQERAPLRVWSLAILGALEPTISADAMARGNQAVLDFCAYLKTLIARRKAKPLDANHDVLTRLIQGDPQGNTLSELELLHNCIFILNAGHETTTNLIANALVLLCEWPEQRAKLLKQADLIKAAIEECLRFESSNQLGNRRAIADTSINGHAIANGSLITLCIGAANRDPAVFEHADQFDITRQPNKHLAFGAGVHVCAGLSLARLEGQIAIAHFLERYPNYKLAKTPVRNARARFRGFESVWVSLK